MEVELQVLLDEALEAVSSASSLAQLDSLDTHYLGRKGKLTGMMRLMSALDPADRPAAGQKLNATKQAITAAIASRRHALERIELDRRLNSEAIDISLPGRAVHLGRAHPLTGTMARVKQALIGLGFTFLDGPDLEEYRYNFAALNYPPDHAALDEQMSFVVDDTYLLRTQTTAIQGRAMEVHRPPFRFATIGRCYRNDEMDATHHHTFHQVDCFMVDRGVSMADLKGTLGAFARRMFGDEVTVRFRPDFFPFVEPGVDYSITWKGGWLELGGAGMIHPNILRAHGIDPYEWSGFAFGLGIERIPMIQRGIDDLRLFLENDIRFLQRYGD